MGLEIPAVVRRVTVAVGEGRVGRLHIRRRGCHSCWDGHSGMNYYRPTDLYLGMPSWIIPINDW